MKVGTIGVICMKVRFQQAVNSPNRFFLLMWAVTVASLLISVFRFVHTYVIST